MRQLAEILVFCLLILSGCSGCSKSGRIVRYNERSGLPITTSPENQVKSEEQDQAQEQVPGKDQVPASEQDTGGGNIVRMRQESGVYWVPVEINGVSMEFIFDTGASDITFSETEARFLFKQGKLSEEDIKGKRQYMTADGSIAEGTVIILKTVKIGNKQLENVEASIVHNMEAPLLIGQSALSRFGRITIDYNRQELSFN